MIIINSGDSSYNQPNSANDDSYQQGSGGYGSGNSNY